MRLDGWEARLGQVIEAARARPYELGAWDCFRVSCLVVEALTGVDRWPEFAGYRTEREALRRLACHGSTFEEAGDWFFQCRGLDARQARRGDICAIRTLDGQKHLGVCVGARAAFLAPDGLLFVPTLSALCCWRIG